MEVLLEFRRVLFRSLAKQPPARQELFGIKRGKCLLMQAELEQKNQMMAECLMKIGQETKSRIPLLSWQPQRQCSKRFPGASIFPVNHKYNLTSFSSQRKSKQRLCDIFQP